MDRREFLLSGLVAGAGLILPATALAAPEGWNMERLMREIEGRFDCYMGPQSAFYETMPGSFIPLAREHTAGDSYETERHTFVTYACAIEGGSAADAEARMAKYFWKALSEVPKTALVWRLKPTMASEEIIKWGDTYKTWEERQGAVFDIPPGVEEDLETQQLKYVAGRNTLHRMRMRLSFPEYSELEYAGEGPFKGVIKAEGTLTRKI
jgi:hypothetical protein